jgi:pimeloyl-ACP methyl ester carboxylesterase
VDDPVVLIHGLGCNWHHYSRQIGWLAHARRVVAVSSTRSTTPPTSARLIVLASFGWLPEAMSHSRDDQMTFIKDHDHRQIAEERVGAAFTASADQCVRAWMVDMIASGDKEGYQSEAQTTLHFNVRDRLHEITVPTTVIHGDHDATVPVAVGRALAEAIPGATLRIIPGEGHYAIVQVPEKMNPIFAEALAIPQEIVPKR